MTKRPRRGAVLTWPVAIAACGALLLGGALAVVLWPGSPRGTLLNPDDPAVVAQGAALYAAHCASCHGAALEGQPDWRIRNADGRLPAPPHDATGHTWHHDADTLLRLTRDGVGAVIGDPDYRSDMPAYGDILNDAQIAAVLSYIKSTWPAEIRAAHNARSAR